MGRVPFSKLIQLSELSPDGEPTIQIVRPGDLKVPWVKCASEAMDYIKHVKPVQGKTIILILAVTAYEFYGGNNNGDGWTERPMIIGPTRITEDDVLPKHHKSFEVGGNVFRHHINKDPLKKIGDILKSFYNWPMHRVELLLELDNEKAEDFVERIEKGEFIPGSMGCRIKFDVCVCCGNKAKNRSEYCDHAKFHLGEYLPSGKRVIVLNPSPRFFDFSLIRKPAERIAYMIKKVADVTEIVSSAELGERIENLQDKAAAFRKLSLIKKVLEGQAVAAKDDQGEITRLENFKDHIAVPAAKATPPLGDETIREMIKYRPAEVLSTLSSMGIFMTTPEFIKFFVWKAMPDAEIPEEALDKAVAMQGKIFDLLAEKPEIAEEMEETGFLDLSPENINDDLIEKFKPLLEKRSQAGQYLYRHLVPDIFKTTSGRGHWDPVNVTDPRTGVPYQTTQRAVTQAQDYAGKKQLTGLLGGGALLAGGLKMLSLPFLKYLAPFAAVPGGMMLAKGLEGPPGVRSRGGQFVPHGTELGIKRGELDEGRAMIDLAQDLAMTKKAEVRTRIEGETLDVVAHHIGEAVLNS